MLGNYVMFFKVLTFGYLDLSHYLLKSSLLFLSDSCGGRMLLFQSQGTTDALMFLRKQRLIKLRESTRMPLLTTKLSFIGERV